MDLHSYDEVSSSAETTRSSDTQAVSVAALGWIALILFVFLLVFFWPIVTPSSAHREHIGQDLLTKDYPFRLYALREFLSGRIPLWDEHLFGGWPGLANSESALFYPPNIFLVPFWTERGFPYVVFEGWILLHLFFAGLGTAFLGRRYKLSVTGALLAGTVMMCSGFLVAHKIHSNIIQTVVWLPWILLCMERILVDGRRGFLWLCGGCLICAYLGGHPQMAVYLTLVVGLRVAWGIAVAERREQWTVVRRSILLLLVVFVAALSTMAQWLPTRALIAQGERASPTYQSSAEYSLPLEELADTFLPESTKIPGLQLGNEVFYWGILTTLLALFCWPVVRLRGPAGFYLVVGGISLILSLGGATAAHRWAFDFVPGIAWLRASSRWMGVVTLVVALAAGRGLDAVTRDRIFTHGKAARIYALLAGIFFFSLCFLFLLLIIQRFFLPAASVSDTTPLLRQLAWILICLVTLVGGLVLYELGKLPSAVLSGILILLVFLDLATVHSSREIEPGPGGFVWGKAVKTILDDPQPGRVKIYFGPEGTDRRQYNGDVFGFRELDGESPFRPRDYVLRQEKHLTRLEDPLRINYRFLDLFSTKYILTDVPIPGGGWKQRSPNFWYKPGAPPTVRWYPSKSYLVVDPSRIPTLLASQALPYDRVALVGRDPFDRSERPLQKIPGTSVSIRAPVVALSVSANGIQHQAVILIGDKNYSKNGTGYNIVVVDPETGEVTASDCFNTMADFVDGAVLPGAPENSRMVRFLDRVPNGHIVIAAIREEGTNILQPETVRALWSCGSQVDLRKRLRLAHAMIGVKGAPPGSALEVVSATEALLMTDAGGSWLQVPEPNPSQAEARLKCTRLDARSLWEHLNAFPVSLPPAASYSICDGTALLRIPIVVFSSPKDDTVPNDVESDRAGLIIGASDYSPNQRGYNLAWFNPITGRVVARGAFDISQDWDVATGAVVPGTPENNRMIRFLEEIPSGAVVVGAVRDEGCNILQPETVQALRSVGCELDLRKKFRWAHAFVGVKGAPPGAAVEIASSTHVIIFATVQKGSVPEINVPLPELAMGRRATLLAQRIPLFLSEGAKRLGNEPDRTSSSKVSPANKEIAPVTPSFPQALETDLRQSPNRPRWSMIRLSPETYKVVGSVRQDGILFMSEPFSPGWRAYLDGRPVEIFRMFHFFQGIRIPAGAHTLRMVYQPSSVARGVMLSGLGLVIWMGWGMWLLLCRRGTRLNARRCPNSKLQSSNS